LASGWRGAGFVVFVEHDSAERGRQLTDGRTNRSAPAVDGCGRPLWPGGST